MRCFVGANPRCHLVLQMEFPLLQRLLFDFFFSRDLTLRREFRQPMLTLMVFFDPITEFRIFTAENLLNVGGTIRHRFSSFESTIRRLILTPENGTVT